MLPLILKLTLWGKSRMLITAYTLKGVSKCLKMVVSEVPLDSNVQVQLHQEKGRGTYTEKGI